MSILKLITLSIFLIFISNFAFASKKVTVIALTDLHGELASEKVETARGDIVPVGGAALLSSYVKAVRTKSKNPVLIIDAGDLFQGTLVSNLQEGEPVIKFYKYLGLSAAAIGNHDFDYGPIGKQAVVMFRHDDPIGALKDRINEAKEVFPFLASNIFYKKNGMRPKWAKPSVMIETEGINVGIVGATAEDTSETTIKSNVLDLDFLEPEETIVDEAEKLREEGADFVILTIHEGGSCRKNYDNKQNDISSCSGSVFKIIKKIPQNTFDLVVAGHTHAGISKIYGKTGILQAHAKASHMGIAELSDVSDIVVHPLVPICGKVVKKRGKTTCNKSALSKARTKPITPVFWGLKIYPDKKVEKLLKDDFKNAEKFMNAPLKVRTERTFTKTFDNESSLGNLLADILLKVFENDGVELAMINNSTIRENIKAKDLVYNDIFEVMPFDTLAAIVTLKGRTLKKMIELGLKNKDGGLSWAGLSFSANDCFVKEVLVNGKPLKDTQEYKLLTTQFLATGSIGFSTLKIKAKKVRILNEVPPLRDIFAESIKRFGSKIDPADFYDPKKPRQLLKGTCKRVKIIDKKD